MGQVSDPLSRANWISEEQEHPDERTVVLSANGARTMGYPSRIPYLLFRKFDATANYQIKSIQGHFLYEICPNEPWLIISPWLFLFPFTLSFYPLYLPSLHTGLTPHGQALCWAYGELWDEAAWVLPLGISSISTRNGVKSSFIFSSYTMEKCRVHSGHWNRGE